MRLPDEIWIDDVAGWFVRGLLYGVIAAIVAYSLVAYGEHRMSKVALQAFTDANRCTAILAGLVPQAEAAASELALHAHLQGWVLSLMESRGETRW